MLACLLILYLAAATASLTHRNDYRDILDKPPFNGPNPFKAPQRPSALETITKKTGLAAVMPTFGFSMQIPKGGHLNEFWSSLTDVEKRSVWAFIRGVTKNDFQELRNDMDASWETMDTLYDTLVSVWYLANDAHLKATALETALIDLSQRVNALEDQSHSCEPTSSSAPSPSSEPTSISAPSPSSEPTSISAPSPSSEPTSITEPTSSSAPSPSSEPTSISAPSPNPESVNLVLNGDFSEFADESGLAPRGWNNNNPWCQYYTACVHVFDEHYLGFSYTELGSEIVSQSIDVLSDDSSYTFQFSVYTHENNDRADSFFAYAYFYDVSGNVLEQVGLQGQATWTPVIYSFTSTTDLSNAVRIEIQLAGSDAGYWAGQAGPRFSGIKLFATA